MTVTDEDREAARNVFLMYNEASDRANQITWGWCDGEPLVQTFARHRQLSAAAERARIVAAVERELSMTALANAEEASTDWIDGFEHAWRRARIAIERGEV